ncbi:MAG: agmatinase [Alphaproteobacteria bacterium]|nr:agmatinase [Alphaproteobacteria bacterium]
MLNVVPKTQSRFMAPGEGMFDIKPQDAVSPEQAKAWIIPFGFEKTVSYGLGTRRGPQMAIRASHEMELFDESLWKEPFRDYGVATFYEPPMPDDHQAALDLLSSYVQETIDAGKFPLMIGGEHSLTPGAIKPLSAKYPKLTVLQFDAHGDLRDEFRGNRLSHANAMRRCLDHLNVNLVAVGIRSISRDEIPFWEANQNRIKTFFAKDKRTWTPAEIAAAVGTGPVYITFDIDGFDSSMIPATGTPEPGGLFWDETMDILKAVTSQAQIVGADVVELAPNDAHHACDFLTAKLIYKILTMSLCK